MSALLTTNDAMLVAGVRAKATFFKYTDHLGIRPIVSGRYFIWDSKEIKNLKIDYLRSNAMQEGFNRVGEGFVDKPDIINSARKTIPLEWFSDQFPGIYLLFFVKNSNIIHLTDNWNGGDLVDCIKSHKDFIDFDSFSLLRTDGYTDREQLTQRLREKLGISVSEG